MFSGGGSHGSEVIRWLVVGGHISEHHAVSLAALFVPFKFNIVPSANYNNAQVWTILRHFLASNRASVFC